MSPTTYPSLAFHADLHAWQSIHWSLAILRCGGIKRNPIIIDIQASSQRPRLSTGIACSCCPVKNTPQRLSRLSTLTARVKYAGKWPKRPAKNDRTNLTIPKYTDCFSFTTPILASPSLMRYYTHSLHRHILHLLPFLPIQSVSSSRLG